MEIVSLFHFLRLLAQKRNRLLFSSPCLFWSLCNCLGTEKKSKGDPHLCFPCTTSCPGNLVDLASVCFTGGVFPAFASRMEFCLVIWPKPKLREINESEPVFTEKLTLVKRLSPQSVFYLYLISSEWCLALLCASFAVSLSNKQYLVGVFIKVFALLCARVNLVSFLHPLRNRPLPTSA